MTTRRQRSVLLPTALVTQCRPAPRYVICDSKPFLAIAVFRRIDFLKLKMSSSNELSLNVIVHIKKNKITKLTEYFTWLFTAFSRFSQQKFYTCKVTSLRVIRIATRNYLNKMVSLVCWENTTLFTASCQIAIIF